MLEELELPCTITTLGDQWQLAHLYQGEFCLRLSSNGKFRQPTAEMQQLQEGFYYSRSQMHEDVTFLSVSRVEFVL